MYKILVVDDDYGIRSIMKDALKNENYNVKIAESGEDGLQYIKNQSFDLVITDMVMPPGINGIELMEKALKINGELGFIVITAYGTIKTAVEALKKGAFDFITKPFSVSQMTSRIERFFENYELKEENKQLKQELSYEKKFKRLVGKSKPMRTIYEQIDVVADSSAPVLLQGESGTGKELIAQAIHDHSNRSNKPFIRINCAAIPETLFESTLFGHEKGAFTHAIKTKKGLFEEAQEGTLLLDEISEIPISMQAKLLRVLQEEEITRVGGSKDIPINVRVIATTNRDIRKLIKEEKFRSDLYFRLNVFPIKVPPLRNRTGDIPILINHFINKFKKKYNYEDKDISQELIDVLCNKKWPGNVRQLENLVERAILYSGENSKLKIEHFDMESHPISIDDEQMSNDFVTIDEMEKRLILRTLKKTDNNRTKAAEILGVSVRTIRNKLNQYKEDGVEIPE
ncbi:MAG: sigma-54 dependent transcriptional regulator [Candidatus Marinimicrobia bacterium]|nr:sigma-54 dependent transcriptional regulator [Candidatus Neomarinimicrobiota bacterium]